MVPNDDTIGDLKVKVWYGGDAAGNTWCEKTIVNFFPGNFPLGPARDLYVEFPAIRAGTCSGSAANLDQLFTQAGAIQFRISGAALDMRIDNIDVAIFDWGDLPETADCATTKYATTEACKGPRHVVRDFYLGARIDPNVTGRGEFNGQPSPDARGDDNNPSIATDDEDGVQVLPAPGITPPLYWTNGPNGGRLSVDVTGSGYLVGWVDFADDGFGFSDAIINQPVGPGLNQVFTFNVPAGTFPPDGNRTLYGRFRLFPTDEVPLTPQLAFDGRAANGVGQSKGGEVEDYRWDFRPLAVTLAMFQAEARTDHVLVTWETNSELNNRGFNLWRGTAPAGPDRQLNETLIPSQSQGNPGGFTYT